MSARSLRLFALLTTALHVLVAGPAWAICADVFFVRNDGSNGAGTQNDPANVLPAAPSADIEVIYLYVGDVDATYAKAMAAGATSICEPADQFYGDRTGTFEDPFGHRWHVTTHIEDVTPEEMAARAAEAGGA